MNSNIENPSYLNSNEKKMDNDLIEIITEITGLDTEKIKKTISIPEQEQLQNLYTTLSTNNDNKDEIKEALTKRILNKFPSNSPLDNASIDYSKLPESNENINTIIKKIVDLIKDEDKEYTAEDIQKFAPEYKMFYPNAYKSLETNTKLMDKLIEKIRKNLERIDSKKINN